MNYLVIDGWSSSRKIPIDIIGETSKEFKIKALERAFLRGCGILKEGQSTLVPKSAVKLEVR